MTHHLTDEIAEHQFIVKVVVVVVVKIADEICEHQIIVKVVVKVADEVVAPTF